MLKGKSMIDQKTKGEYINFTVIGNASNGVRIIVAHEMKALIFKEKSKDRITTKKGKCISFHQLSINIPNGENAIFLRGDKDSETILKKENYKEKKKKMQNIKHKIIFIFK